MSIDPNDRRPAYQQIAGQLRASIAAGEYGPGDPMPSERELAQRYGVTAVTSRHALAELVAERLIEARRGRGYFVTATRPHVHVSSAYVTQEAGQETASWRSEVERQGREPGQQILGVGRSPASAEVAQRLGLSEGDQVVVRRRLLLIDGQPHQLATSFYPEGVAAGTPLERRAKIRGGTIAALTAAGHEPGRHLEEISVRATTPEERRALGIDAGVPVIRLLRTTYDVHGQPVEVSDALMPADRHTLLYELPARHPS